MAHWRYGPWGPNREYVWINAEEMRREPESRLEIHVRPNIAYASPVDGTPVTTWAKRRDDMARHGCMDAREARECAQDARRNWKTGLEGLTLAEVERTAASLRRR